MPKNVVSFPIPLKDLEKELLGKDVRGSEGLFLGCKETRPRIVEVYVDEPQMLSAARRQGVDAGVMLAAAQEVAAAVLKNPARNHLNYDISIVPCIC